MFTVLLATLFVSFGHALNTCPAIEHVNSFIGTGGLAYGYGGVNPAAQYPHGPMKLGPDTTNSIVDVRYRHFSGYNYLDTEVRGFSHTHLVGAGMAALGNIGVMPVRVGQHFTTEDDVLKSGIDIDIDVSSHNSTRVWWSKFNKTSETASPGQYNVFLETPQVHASLLATSTHTGIHKYSFQPSTHSPVYAPGLIVDVCHAAQIGESFKDVIHHNDCRNASITVSEDMQSFTATVYTDNYVWVHLYGRFEGKAAKKWTTCNNGDSSISCNADSTAASDNGLLFSYVSFGPSVGQLPSSIELHVGLSFISTAQAQINLEAVDKQGLSISQQVDKTRGAWCDTLGFMAISPLETDAEIVSMLHSANYRAHLTPSMYTEVGGVYPGLDNEVHNAVEERAAKYPTSTMNSVKATTNFYSDLSLWDTFRTLHPWLLLTDENLAVGIMRSVVEMTAQENGYPKWVLGNREVGCMVGLHGGSLALEAGLVGLSDEFDIKSLQQMLLNQAVLPWPVHGRADLDFYMANGYVSSEAADNSATLTMTYSYDDAVLAGLSTLVGDAESAEAAAKRSKNYKNIWSDADQYVCPRSAAGELNCFRTPISPESWTHFTEGDTLHWSSFVVHDPEGYKGLFPSEAAFNANLESFFANHVAYQEEYGSTVPNPYFWIGNEVCAFSVWLFNYGNQCTRAQYWSRNITHMHFSDTPHGVPGNEDYGAMASWLLFSSLGIFPQAGTTNFLVGSPRVREAAIKLDHIIDAPSTLTIKTINNSDVNVFVQKLLVNGVEHTSPIIDRSVLADPAGCTLEFFMSSVEHSSLC